LANWEAQVKISLRLRRCQIKTFEISRTFDKKEVKIQIRAEVWRGSLKERDHLGDLSVDERIIIKCGFEK